MAFGQVSKILEIPAQATATFTFHRIELVGPDPDGTPRPVKITTRHVGDGTPAYKRASWHAAQSARARATGDKISESITRERLLMDARMIADHCVVAWEHVYEDGQTTPAPCTADKVFEFLSAVIHSQEGLKEFAAFRSWAGDPETYRPSTSPPDAVAALGKA